MSSDVEEPSARYKKRRVQGACDECRRRKVKCNRSGNVCTSCITLKTECTHFLAASKKKRGPPKGTPRGQRTVKSIVNSLLSQGGLSYEPPEDPSAVKKLLLDFAIHIRELETEISRLKFSKENSIVPSTSSPHGVIAPPGSYLDADARAIYELTEEMETLHIDHDKKRHFGRSSTFTLLKTAMDIKNGSTGKGKDFESYTELSFKRPEFWTIHPWQILPENDPPPYEFPDDDLLQELVKLYLDNINTLLPILHRPSFLRSIAEDLHLEDKNFGAVVLAVCAAGARFSQDPRVFEEGTDSEQSVGWKFIRQVHPIKSNFIAPPCLYELQLYGIYVIFMQSTSTPEHCWVLISLGIKLAQDIGIHRARKSKPTLESELSKRVFYILYVMDIFVSSLLGRPCSISTEDFDVDLPIDCDDESWEHSDPELAFKRLHNDKPSAALYWVSFIKLIDIMGYAIRTIYAVRRTGMSSALDLSALEWNRKIVAELDSSLNKWADEMPNHLKWDPKRENLEHFRQSVVVHTMYWMQILVHKLFIPPIGQASVLGFPSLAICVNAAKSCFHVIHIQEQRNVGLLVMPGVMTALFNSSIVLLVNVWRGRRLKTSDSLSHGKELADVHRSIGMLQLYEKRWEVAGRLSYEVFPYPTPSLSELGYRSDLLEEAISVSRIHHKVTSLNLKRSREDEGASSNRALDDFSMDGQSYPRQIADVPAIIQAEKAASILDVSSLPIFKSFEMDQRRFNPRRHSDSSPASSSHTPQFDVSSTDFPSVSRTLLAPYSRNFAPEGLSLSLDTGTYNPGSTADTNSTQYHNIKDSNSAAVNEWDDWEAYMASVDDVLLSMNPRIF